MKAIMRRSAVGLCAATALGIGLSGTEAKAWSLEEAAAPYKGNYIRK